MGEFPNKLTQFTTTSQPENNGRPKGAKGIKTIIRKYIEQEIDHKNPLSGEKEKLSVAEHIILTALAKAISGDDKSREDILNRYFGKVSDKVVSKDITKRDKSLKELKEEISVYRAELKKKKPNENLS